MKKTLITLAFFSLLAKTTAQQLYLDVFTGYNRTIYEPDFPEQKPYLVAGARLAAGSDWIQLGGEARTNVTNPAFEFGSREDTHKETYCGGFVRAKLAKYPAMRFGLVVRAGAGVHQIETHFNGNLVERLDYGNVFGMNGGAGFSIPLARAVMLELGYTYNYVKRPERAIPGLIVAREFDGHFHSVQAGLSLNFVFGKRAAEYREVRESRQWRK